MNLDQGLLLNEIKHNAIIKGGRTSELMISKKIFPGDLSSIKREAMKILILEQLNMQGFITVKKNNNNDEIQYMSITNLGITALSEYLLIAGSINESPALEIDRTFIEAIEKIIEMVESKITAEHEQLMEYLTVIKEQLNQAKPKKNVIIALLGFVYKSTEFAAAIATIMSAANIDINGLLLSAGIHIR